MKPELPKEIAGLFPPELVARIYEFTPHLRPKPQTSPLCTYSPEMERDLRRLQKNALKGKSEMYLRDLDYFVLCRR